MFVQKRMERCGRNVLTKVPPRGDGSNRYSTSEMIGVRNQIDHQMTTHSFAINGHFISINEPQIFFQVPILLVDRIEIWTGKGRKHIASLFMIACKFHQDQLIK